MEHAIAGCVGGALGIAISYPLLTIKTLMQTGTRINPRYLYKGFAAPCIGTVLEKTSLFAACNITNSSSQLFNGIVGGVVTSVVVTPYERFMIAAQTHPHMNTLAVCKYLRGTNLMRGWSASLFREVPGYCIYFTAYESTNGFRNTYNNTLSIALSGAFAGVSAWMFIYPIDVVKTISQKNNITPIQAVQQLNKTSNVLRTYTRGLTPALMRAALLHSGVFVGYTHMLEYIV